jgi:hypothetical protein
LPRLLHLPALPAMDLRVASNLASFSTSGDEAWSFLRSFAPPLVPADQSPGCPGFCIFRLCRRRIFGLPRISRPSVPLLLMPWVAPRHCSSSGAYRCGCEYPRFLHLPALPWVQVSGSPRTLSPSAPAGGFPSCLGSRTFRLCRPRVFGLPRILHLRLGQ